MGGTYIALSKNMSTPPIKKNPPVAADQHWVMRCAPHSRRKRPYPPPEQNTTPISIRSILALILFFRFGRGVVSGANGCGLTLRAGFKGKGDLTLSI
jgi:hypothetical protein